MPSPRVFNNLNSNLIGDEKTDGRNAGQPVPWCKQRQLPGYKQVRYDGNPTYSESTLESLIGKINSKWHNLFTSNLRLLLSCFVQLHQDGIFRCKYRHLLLMLVFPLRFPLP